jgi:hypothetical protein
VNTLFNVYLRTASRLILQLYRPRAGMTDLNSPKSGNSSRFIVDLTLAGC